MGPTPKSKASNRSARHSTPLSSAAGTPPPPIPAMNTGELPYLGTSLSSLLVPTDLSIEGLIDEPGPNSLPSAGALNVLREKVLNSILAHVNLRGQVCDRSMRELAKLRKQRIGAEREAEERKRIEEERRKRQSNSVTPMKRDRDTAEDDTRPPAVGAHGVSRQDGVKPPQDVTMGSPSETVESKPQPSASSPVEHQPAPAVVVAQYQSFGDDPTQYNDPTIYGIRDITPDMSEEEKKEILSVATYPHDDLADLTPGTPADHDYSNAKPANQVTFGAFLTYLEPFVRQLTEEDVAFLKERSDRVQPFIIPARGTMHYRHVWAKEDGGMVPRDPYNGRLPPNEARGSIEDMNDEVSTTEDVSSDPLLSRMLATLRHDPPETVGASITAPRDGDGDVPMTNGDGDESAIDNTTRTVTKPATYFPELSNTAAKTLPGTTSPMQPYASIQQRILGEMRFHGFLTSDQTPTYDGQYDDQVAERLRLLQAELRQVSVENAARKARVLELTEERMAMQEYSTIADDLDNQINAAYTKRNRTMNRPKKGANKARPQTGLAGVGVGRNTVSEGVRMLMERRLQWRDQIGPVVDYGRKNIPKQTVFDDETMDRLIKVESEIAGVGDET